MRHFEQEDAQQPQQIPAQCSCPYGQPSPKRSRGTQALITILVFVAAAFVIGFGSYAVILTVQQHMNQTTRSETASDAVGFSSSSENHNQSSGAESTVGSNTDASFKGLTLQHAGTETLSAKKVYRTVSPSVVSIAVRGTTKTTYGSGIVLTEDGYILTAASLLGYNRDAEVTIRTEQNIADKAVVVGFDSTTDLAILKADGTFPSAELAKNTLSVGDRVYTVTAAEEAIYHGVLNDTGISSIDRTVSYDSVNVSGCSQLNSRLSESAIGGAAVNESGQVTGMVLVDEEGQSYLLPMERVSQKITDLIRNGYVTGKVRLGISGIAITQEDADAYGVPKGVVIVEIQKNGGFAETDAQAGDIITKMDGVSIVTMGDISAVLEKHQAGDTIEVELYRMMESGESETKTVQVTLKQDTGQTQE